MHMKTYECQPLSCVQLCGSLHSLPGSSILDLQARIMEGRTFHSYVYVNVQIVRNILHTHTHILLKSITVYELMKDSQVTPSETETAFTEGICCF